MIVERAVFHARYGVAHELVDLIKEAGRIMKKQGYPEGRVLTDITGRMYTIVWETDFESLAAYEEARKKIFEVPEFGPWFEKMLPLVEYGTSELYTVE